jgi:hypothetical protein
MGPKSVAAEGLKLTEAMAPIEQAVPRRTPPGHNPAQAMAHRQREARLNHLGQARANEAPSTAPGAGIVAGDVAGKSLEFGRASRRRAGRKSRRLRSVDHVRARRRLESSLSSATRYSVL